MTRIITTDYGQRYKTPDTSTTVGAIIAGSMASSGIQLAQNKGAVKCIQEMKKLSETCDTVTLKNAVNKAFADSGLAAKGVKLMDVNEKAVINSKYDFLPKFLKKFSPIEAVKKGNNAIYYPSDKAVMVNLDKFGISAFHEMGHAVNHNCSKLWKCVQKIRQPMLCVAGLMTSIALFKRPKAEGEQPKNGFDRATTFIKNNIGKLVTLCLVPIVAEELKATQRGNKMAKNVLSAEMFAKVKKFNKGGAVTYMSMALAMGLGAFVSTKIRDKIAKPEKF